MNAVAGVGSYLLHRMVIPLACGLGGGFLALTLSPSEPVEHRPSDECKQVSAELASLHGLMKNLQAELRTGPSRAHGLAEAPMSSPQASTPSPRTPEEAKKLVENVIDGMREKAEQQRKDFEERRAPRPRSSAEGDLVKLRNTQASISPEETKVNVSRRLKAFGLSEQVIDAAAQVGAPYVRQRADVIVEALERASTGAPVTRAELEEDLRPLDEQLAAGLPSQLDDLTRRAIVTELGSMVRVPYYLQ